MRRFGKIASCIIVKDAATKQSKGCAFVEFEAAIGP